MNVKSKILVFLATASLLVIACGATSPSGTVRKFYGYLQAEDAEKALSLFSVQFVNTLGRDKLLAGIERTIQQVETKGGIKSVQIKEEEIDGDSAKVLSVVRFGNGEESSDTTKLVMEDGSWKLSPSK